MRYDYKDYNGNPAFCDIRIHENVVLATEMPSNTGASLTNTVEILATEMCKKYNIDPADIMFIEHHKKAQTQPEKYELVTFTIDYKNAMLYAPSWARIHYPDALIAKHFPSRKKKKNTVVEDIQACGVAFKNYEEFKKEHGITWDQGTYVMAGEKLGAVGHFRGDFENTDGLMWATWHDGVISNRLQNPAIKAEVEAIMTQLRTGIFTSFNLLYNYCTLINDGNAKEVRLLGMGKESLYMLHLIPYKGDYNMYLFCYAK